jgi:hypothetical protein
LTEREISVPQINPNSSATLRAIGPWIGATAALLVAAILLLRFIDTLHVSIQRGQDLRAGIHTSATDDRNADIRLADVGTRKQLTVR